MKAAKFDYVVAKTVAEAAAALAGEGRSTAAIAGGQSLLPMLNLRLARPDVLVDIAGIEELKAAASSASTIRIGALTTHAEIEDGKIFDRFGGLLQTIASGISYRSIRNYGTIGGSIALADPAADWPVCLIALAADVRIADGGVTRLEPVRDFIRGQYATSLRSNEIIVGFDLPHPGAGLRWGLHKVARKSGAFAEFDRGRGGACRQRRRIGGAGRRRAASVSPAASGRAVACPRLF